MAKRLTFVRHGQTKSNTLKHYNDPLEGLSQEGRYQAQLLGQRLKNQEFDAIFCSPLPRTRLTASFLSKNQVAQIEYCEELAEVDWGDCSGKPYIEEDLTAFHGIEIGRFGETVYDLETRARQFWDRIAETEAKNILIISHGAIMCVLWAFKDGIPPERYVWYRTKEWAYMDNCDEKHCVVK